MKEITRKTYYSDVLDTEFDTVEELEKAEQEAQKQRTEVATENNGKKELALKIEQIDKQIEEAKRDYVSCRESLEKDYATLLRKQRAELEDFRTNCEKSLAEKRKDIRKSETERYDALRSYNEQFGAYKKYITGKDAEREWRKITEMFFNNSFVDAFLNW